MLLKELIRFSTQHRTLYCYLILSIWIFLLIAGMYKYIGNSNSIGPLVFLNGRRGVYATTIEDEENVKFRKYKQRCTPLESLGRKDDGGILDGWKLQGVLMVIRHGDRGPMSHVRGVSYISCGVHGDSLLNRYRSFLYNTTTSNSQSQSAGTNHMFWNKLGPFHGFALLPSHEKSCLLGQLTYKGIAQLLHVGEILHQIYAHPLGLLLRPPHSKHYASSSTPHSLLNSDEVVLYSTRYRRTFQSAMALLFPFLPQDKWLALNVRESHSMAFCFSDCACSRAETLRRKLNAMNGNHLLQHPAVSAIVQWIGSILLQQTATNGMNDPNEVADAVLTVLCHDAPLPCRQITKSSNYTKIATTPQEQQRQQMAAETQAVDFNDVINIDQDDVVAIAQPSNMLDTPPSNAFRSGAGGGGDEMQMMGGGGACIEPNHIAALISYTNWESSMEANHSFYKRIGLMRAYGMIRHIVSYMLKMISGDRTKFVLYSGHDWTMQYLTAALGIQTETTFIPYATRLAIEVYKSEMHTDYYFRVVYNGRDVTQQIDFCEGGKSLRVTRDSRGNKADLCPIENIIRFLHEDYFAPLNATNFKDACANFQRTNSNDFF